jgi:hypothetical protein
LHIPDWALGCLQQLGITDITANSAFIELKKLFDKKRSQVVAIWYVDSSDFCRPPSLVSVVRCLDMASNWWDKVLQRTVKFDALRRKIVARYAVVTIRAIR